MNKKRVAYHESAHALIGWCFGYSLKMVSINPQIEASPDMGGICRASPPGRTEVFSEPAILAAESVYFSIAGRVSDDLFFPGEPDGSKKDFLDVVLMLPPDDTTLRMNAFPRQKSIEDFYRRFKAPVKKILKSSKGKKALKALSLALLKAGTLSGAEAVFILEKSWGKPLPAKARPAADHCSIKDQGVSTYNGLLQSLGTYMSIMFEDINRLRCEFEESENDHINSVRHYMLLVKAHLLSK
ncbi:MAG: hypothetical protein KKD92_14065 [Proteobacteria bacterium]|nr:hypothetical protein [Pseudomonadota bacterium]